MDKLKIWRNWWRHSSKNHSLGSHSAISVFFWLLRNDVICRKVRYTNRKGWWLLGWLDFQSGSYIFLNTLCLLDIFLCCHLSSIDAIPETSTVITRESHFLTPVRITVFITSMCLGLTCTSSSLCYLRQSHQCAKLRVITDQRHWGEKCGQRQGESIPWVQNNHFSRLFLTNSVNIICILPDFYSWILVNLKISHVYCFSYSK